jgi:hypothetical protein
MDILHKKFTGSQTNNRSTKIGAAVSFDDQSPYLPI